MIAIHRNLGPVRAVDAEVVGDKKFAGRQKNCAVGARGEFDDVFARAIVRVENGLDSDLPCRTPPTKIGVLILMR